MLTISTTHTPATDLGYLLLKNPERVHEVSEGSWTANVLYPEASEERCTVALLVEIDPVNLVRGPEYLRIIYGPDYLEPSNLERLRKRGLSRKRSMAIREYQLGEEALHRFVRREPLRRVHECVFGVLALESQPIDPRL